MKEPTSVLQAITRLTETDRDGVHGILGASLGRRNNPKTNSYEPKNTGKTQTQNIGLHRVRFFISFSAFFHLNTHTSIPTEIDEEEVMVLV